MNDSVTKQREMGPLAQQLLYFMGVMKEDFPACLELLSEDVIWLNRLPGHVPFGGQYSGRSEFASYIQRMGATFEIGHYPVEEFDFFESGNTLVIVGYEKDARVIATNTVFDLPFVWVVKFNEWGQICFLQEHNDTAAIGDAFRS